MEFIIENGKTIIRTGDPNGGVKNKFNKPGVSQCFDASGTKYKAEIQIDRKKYYLGIRDTPEEAIELRSEAERQIEAGTFEEWLKTIKKTFARNRYEKMGISRQIYPSGQIRYQVEVRYRGARQYVGKRHSLDEAYKLREEAEQQIANNTFEPWLAELRTNNYKNRYKKEIKK